MMTSYMKPELGATQTLPEFLETTGVLSENDKIRIINQAHVLIDDLYAHLPLKRAMHAIDPVQQLKLLRRRSRAISERSFHNEMIAIFMGLRDLHTNYILPQPYTNKTAFLPFLIEEYFDERDTHHYIVSKMIADFTHDTFKPGVKITHWSGIPINTAVKNNADREAGSNEFARHVRGLDRMTIRPMMMSLPPDEEWVIVSYNDGTNDLEIRLPWTVFSPDSDPHAIAIESGTNMELLATQGVDLLTEVTNRARKVLFAPKAMEVERKAEGLRAKGDATPENFKKAIGNISTMPEVFQFKTVDTPSGQFGYVRIHTFRPGPEDFIPELIHILEMVPQNGLIIDVRGNGGGTITSGERMLQLFTPNKVTAERLQFINTEETLSLSKTSKWDRFLQDWQRSIELSLSTGAIYSQGLPIEDPDVTNAIGQKYRGPVVLITDARCYSTTDIFAAGFQDNKIGVILGVDGNTGAGGANVFTHDLLKFLFSSDVSPIKPLPHGASMRVAIRRTIRVGDNAGLPVEDVGVTPDKIHKITSNDLLNGNEDLINAAAAILVEE